MAKIVNNVMSYYAVIKDINIYTIFECNALQIQEVETLLHSVPSIRPYSDKKVITQLWEVISNYQGEPNKLWQNQKMINVILN